MSMRFTNIQGERIQQIAGQRVKVSKPTIKKLLQDVEGYTIENYKLATHVIALYHFKLGSFSDDLYFYSNNDYEPSYKIGLKPYDYKDEGKITRINHHSVVLRVMFNAISGHENTKALLSDMDALELVIGNFLDNFHQVSGIELELEDVPQLYLTLEQIALRTEKEIERDIKKMLFICESDELQYFKEQAVAVKNWDNIDDYEIIREVIPDGDVDQVRIVADPNERGRPELRGYAVGVIIEALEERLTALMDDNTYMMEELILRQAELERDIAKREELALEFGEAANTMPAMIEINNQLANSKDELSALADDAEAVIQAVMSLGGLMSVRLAQQKWLMQRYDFYCLKMYGYDKMQ